MKRGCHVARWAGLRATWAVVVVITALGLAGLLPGFATHAKAQVPTSPLTILGPARVTLDPVCGGFTVTVRNAGTAPVRLAMSPGALVSRPPGKTAPPTVDVKALDDSGHPGKTTLAPGETVPVRVDLTGGLEAVEWEVELRNAETSFGTVVVVSPLIPFNVKLDVASPDSPELSFTRGQPTRIALRNDDGVPYLVSGEYSLRGRVVLAAQEPMVAAKGGGAEFTMVPADAWFGPRLAGLFKDETADGRLTVRLRSRACQAEGGPSRVFKVKTTLAVWPAATKDWLGNVVLFVTLLLGGLSSALLNFALPIQARRLSVQSQLSLVARRVGDLPAQLDSGVRISVSVEQRQLADRLHRLKWYDTQFATEMTEIDEGIKRLLTRLGILAQTDDVFSRYWRLRAGSLPSSVSEEIEEQRRRLIDLLRRVDPDDAHIKAVQAQIQLIEDRLAKANAENLGIAERLVRQISKLKKDYAATGAIGASPMWASIRAALTEDFDEILGAQAPTVSATIAPADYVRLGHLILVLEQVRDFINLCVAAASSNPLRRSPDDLRATLELYWRAGSWDHLNRAQRLLRQMRENVFHEEIEEQVERRLVIIEPSRSIVRQFEPIALRLVFLDKRLQNAAAREEYTYEWAFGHDGLTEKGWSVSHYFPEATGAEPAAEEMRPRLRRMWDFLVHLPAWAFAKQPIYRKSYLVKVAYIRDNAKMATMAEREIDVRPPLRVKLRASLWMELGRLSLAMFVAAVTLIAGAREQVLKLDVLPALIAVFLIGFGGDRIKNFFTQREPATREEPKSAAAAK